MKWNIIRELYVFMRLHSYKEFQGVWTQETKIAQISLVLWLFVYVFKAFRALNESKWVYPLKWAVHKTMLWNLSSSFKKSIHIPAYSKKTEIVWWQGVIAL